MSCWAELVCAAEFCGRAPHQRVLVLTWWICTVVAMSDATLETAQAAMLRNAYFSRILHRAARACGATAGDH
jgi:hypothetical protein